MSETEHIASLTANLCRNSAIVPLLVNIRNLCLMMSLILLHTCDFTSANVGLRSPFLWFTLATQRACTMVEDNVNASLLEKFVVGWPDTGKIPNIRCGWINILQSGSNFVKNGKKCCQTRREKWSYTEKIEFRIPMVCECMLKVYICISEIRYFSILHIIPADGNFANTFRLSV